MKKSILWCAATLMATASASAQTPFFTEDFEGATTGWTFANGDQTNKWVVGTPTAPAAGTNATRFAYISNGTGDNPNNEYSNATSVVYLYYDVSLPATTATHFRLTFDWRGDGEHEIDYMQVYVVETSTTPTAGVPMSGDPLGGFYDSQSSWQQATLLIPASATAKRIIFCWRNNSYTNTQPPVAIDNVALSAVPITQSRSVHLTAAGTLKDSAGLGVVEKLTVTGSIDARDVAFMRDSMPSLVELDLEGASVVDYTGTAGTLPGNDVSYPADVMPQYSFCTSSPYLGKTSLLSVKLPAGLTSVGQSAFRSCTGLTSLSLPAGITSMGSYAFAYCTSLTSITNLSATPQPIASSVFFSIDKTTCTLIVPSSSLSLYAAADVWKDFTNRVDGGITFAANVNNPELGSVSGTASGLYASGTTISLTATPETGYSFLSWTSRNGSQLSTSPTLNFALTQDSVLTANFGTLPTTTVNLTEAGTLKDVPGIKTISKLTLTGKIDARDVAFMRDSMANLAELDLEGASVVGYTGTAGTIPNYSNIYPANEMPEYSFYKYSLGPGKTSLVSVKLPAGLTSVGNYAFYNCTGLTTVTLPAGLTSIGGYAFYDCSGLTNIANLSLTPQVIASSVFTNVNKTTCTLTVPTSSLSLYAAANVWKEFTNRAGGGIAFAAKANNPVLGNVSGTTSGLYASGTAISLTATPATGNIFLSWTSRSGAQLSTSPTLSFALTQDSVLTANFGKLQTVNLTTAGTLKDVPGIKTVTHLTLTGNIDAHDIAFMYAEMANLAELDLEGASVVSYTGTAGTTAGNNTYPANDMPRYSFYDYSFGPGKTSLVSVKLPAGLTSIGDKAFQGCTGLTTITLPAGLKSIGYDAFQSCTSLTTLTLPAGLTRIDLYAFENCSGLTTVTIPGSITAIGTHAFSNCTGLTAVYNLNAIPQKIDANVFPGVTTSNVDLYVINGAAALYSSADIWKDFKQVLVLTPATSVTLDSVAATLTAGDMLQLTATVQPAIVASQSLLWTSSNTAAATVDNTGKVTAIAAGTASITVATTDGSNKTATCVVVTAAPEVISVAISPATASVQKGTTQQFTATVTVKGDVAQTVSWEVTNGTVRTSISANGLLTIAANETATTLTVTATSTANSSKKGTATVTVAGTTAIVETRHATPLQIYPNPILNEQLIISNEKLVAGDKIELYTLSGALLKTFVAAGAKSSVDVSSLPAGTYVVKAGGAVAKVVKQ
jgi:hypothetical protein